MNFRVLGVLLMLLGSGVLFLSDRQATQLQSQIARAEWQGYSDTVAGGHDSSGREVARLEKERADATQLKMPAIGLLILGLIVAVSAASKKPDAGP